MTTRLLIHVEGQTEETFVNEILRDHLLNHGYMSVSARLVGNARLRKNRGGIRAWSSVRKDIIRHLREDLGAVATLMVDYYALPQTGERAWPGRSGAEHLSSVEKAKKVESALLEDLASHYGTDFRLKRFLPFVLMYEFEGLLFSDCISFARGIGQEPLQTALADIRNDFATPEDINDSAETAPSKRIEALLNSYEKPLHGVLAAMEIGLDSIRAECPHFAEWLSILEGLPG